jgi:hypothetical protein
MRSKKKYKKKKEKEKRGNPFSFSYKKIEATCHLDRNQTRPSIHPCLLLLRAVVPPASLP